MRKTKCSRCGNSMDCPENMLKAENHICSDCVDLMGEEEFVNLSKLLKKDTPIVKNITTIFNKEEEYADYLIAIESNVAEEFLMNKKITDKEIVASLKRIKQNYDKDLNYFKDDFEKNTVASLSYALQMESISKHELMLVIDYILWCIDNRSWIDDKQAYVRWLVNSMGFFDKKEKKNYEEQIRNLGKDKGIPDEQIEAILNNDFESMEFPDDITKAESEFFAMNEDDKFDYVLKNFHENPYLLKMYSEELDENKEYEKAEKFYKKVLEEAPEFPPVEILLGRLYKKMGNNHLAEYHLTNALDMLDKIPDDVMPEIVKEELRAQIKEIQTDVDSEDIEKIPLYKAVKKKK